VPQQKPDISRETFIALRARRQAFRIATDLLYHDTPHEAAPLHPLTYRPHPHHWRPKHISVGSFVLLSMMTLCAIVYVAVAVAEGLIQLPTKW
jgi:hypothetical protein